MRILILLNVPYLDKYFHICSLNLILSVNFCRQIDIQF